MIWKIFGNENAENDDVLYDCPITTEVEIDGTKQIFTGKWGVGKTANLILRSRKLSNKLKEIKPSLERLWYIQEEDLEIDHIILNYSSKAKILFIRFLDRLWKAEIIRRTMMILLHLDEYYGHKTGSHWNDIRKIKK